ncbi:protein phosphatase Slingshot homolog 2 isoform X2 [Osmerus eperlanus]|uniref:protein phosphatase Slingshot homolog 2 isoform X2 n=1 Tax=Osmerus eperlanus TaxID=29151 RepID=UPI002E0D49E6
MALVHVQRSPTPSNSSSPCVSESGSGEDNRRPQSRSISESFLTVKGAALFLPRGNGSSPSSDSRISQRSKHTGDLQQHLQVMFTVLRPEDNIRLAVRLESAYPQSTRYMVVVSTNGRQDTEESVVLGVDFATSDCSCSVGLVLPLWSDTLIHLDGDGGFSVSTVNRVHVFKPVSVQAMWSALQSLHKACEVARCQNYYPGSLFLTWVSYYQSSVSSDQLCINEWNAMQDVQSHRADSPVLFTDVPTERERTERLIKTRLREIMMQKDLENVTSKEIRTELEMQMGCNLREFKEFIDNEMIVILGQMDSPTKIFDHVFLGSEWNASNLEELQNSGVRYILNVTREIDNFFPGLFEYHNIRVYDEEATNLLEYWNDTFKFISKAKKAGAKCLVHCKMGVSRSASTVIAYAMKEYGWDLDTAFDYVKERRAVTKPNPSFMRQLEEYQGILLASKQRHNKLWRSRSDSDLSERHQRFCKPAPDALGHSHPENNNNNAPPSLHHFLGAAVLQALRADPQDSSSPPSDTPSDAAERAHARARLHASCPPVSNGHGELRGRVRSQDPVLPPRPRPRAATVVPEERRDTASLKATLALPLVTPHPPRDLHILPPSTQTPPRPASPPPPEHKGLPAGLSLDLPDPSSSEETSSEAETPASSLSELVSDRLDSTGFVPMAVSPLSPTATPLEGPFPSNDHNNNNNPSSPAQAGGLLDSPTDGSSSLSTDSIDFVSAREKFLGLSQDDRTRSLSEQGPQRTAPSSEEPSPEEDPEQGKISPHAEGGVDRPTQDKSSHLHLNHSHLHDNGVSVRHIVTEIESISHPPPRSPQQPRPDHGEEDQETGEVTRGSLTPPSYPQSPSTPPPDWPVGSVRRVTKQLERRLRQELDAPALPAQRSPEQPPPQSLLCPAGGDLRSPLPSPSAEAPPPARSPPPFPSVPAHTPNTDCPSSLRANCPDLLLLPCPSQPTLPISTGATHGTQPCPSQPSPPRDGEASDTDSKRGLSGFSDMDTLPDPHPEPSPVILRPSLDPHPKPLASPGALLWLEGVTFLDSETDPDPPCDPLARLAPSSRELERIQETLRELQAFLYEAGGQAGVAESLEQDLVQAERAQAMGPDTERELGQGPGPRRPPRETPVWQRAMEIEARIRQAGLTPPSLMKRSASLAKLDCLELSTNDLSDWELCPAPYIHPCSSVAPQDPPSVTHPHPSPDDVWKKQRVLSRSPPRSLRGQTVRAGGGGGGAAPGGVPSPSLARPRLLSTLSPPSPAGGRGGGRLLADLP